jgi:hypothetical protein
VAPVVSNPVAGYASPLDRLGFGVLVGCTAQSILLSVPPAPPAFIWRRATGAHQPSGLDAPDQVTFVRARPDSNSLKSGSAGDQTNTTFFPSTVAEGRHDDVDTQKPFTPSNLTKALHQALTG